MNDEVRNEDERNEDELWWVNYHDWLAGLGYQLRPRYAPGWTPSWVGSKKRKYDAEDGIQSQNSHRIMDAVRKLDGKYVVLKRFDCKKHPFEKEITQFLCQGDLASDPKNHCVRIIEFLEIPDSDTVILVMPLLREIGDPMFETVGELMGCLHQLFEGLQFMHKHHVAHRDCNYQNIMMDASSMFIDPWHPVYMDKRRNNIMKDARYYSRTKRPPKYYWIDYGISRRFDANETSPLADPIKGGDKTVPEFQEITGPVNPFPTDIYYLGNLVRELDPTDSEGLKFLQPLIDDMVQEDPSKRPTIDEAVKRLDELCDGLTMPQLRSPLRFDVSNGKLHLTDTVSHWLRQIWYILLRFPAIPSSD